jgi:hypothetical protein
VLDYLGLKLEGWKLEGTSSLSSLKLSSFQAFIIQHLAPNTKHLIWASFNHSFAKWAFI